MSRRCLNEVLFDSISFLILGERRISQSHYFTETSVTRHSRQTSSPYSVKSQAVMETSFVFLLLSCLPCWALTEWITLCLYSIPFKMMLLCSVGPVEFDWVRYHPLSCSCVSEVYHYLSLCCCRAMCRCLKLTMRTRFWGPHFCFCTHGGGIMALWLGVASLYNENKTA